LRLRRHARKQAIFDQLIDLAKDLLLLALGHQARKRRQTGGEQTQQRAKECHGQAGGDAANRVFDLVH
jgi:hypothetical protein